MGGDGFRMIQAHYICSALYFYYYYIVIYKEIIIQPTIMLNQGESWDCFRATRRSHLGVRGDSDTLSVFLCPVYSMISFWLLSLQKTLLHTGGMLEVEAGFSVRLWPSQVFPLDLNPELKQICSRPNIHLRPLSSAISSSRSSSNMDSRFTLLVHKWVADLFLPSSGVFVVGKLCSNSSESGDR